MSPRVRDELLLWATGLALGVVVAFILLAWFSPWLVTA